MNIPEQIKLFINKTTPLQKIEGLAIIIVVVYFTYTRFLSPTKSQAHYVTSTATTGTLITTVSESGNVTSGSQAGVGSPTTGVVQEIYVKDGDVVKQGQNLFKVESTANAQERAGALASLLQAKSTLNNANASSYSLQSTMYSKWQIYTNLAVSGMYQNGDLSPNTTNRTLPQFTTAQDDWLAAQANYQNQQNVIAQAQANLTNASLAYGATQNAIVTAPISGSVANLTVQPGDQITASGGNLSTNVSSTTSTNAVLYIGDYSKPYIKVQATEIDIPNIHAGQKATISVDAYPNKSFVGIVNQVDTSGTVSSGVVTYNVFVTFVAPPQGVLPGMSASVIIQTNRKDDVVSVPTSAIQTSTTGSTVRIMKNGVVTSVPVETGLVSDTNTEIISGVSENDVIVTGTTNSSTQTTSSTTSPFGRAVGGGGFGGGGVRTGGVRGG